MTIRLHHARIQTGGTGGLDSPPLKNHKNIAFLSKTGTDPLKNYKTFKPASNVGPSLAFCWRADDGPLIVVFGSYLPSSTKTKQSIKTFSLLDPSDKTF